MLLLVIVFINCHCICMWYGLIVMCCKIQMGDTTRHVHTLNVRVVHRKSSHPLCLSLIWKLTSCPLADMICIHLYQKSHYMSSNPIHPCHHDLILMKYQLQIQFDFNAYADYFISTIRNTFMSSIRFHTWLN